MNSIMQDIKFAFRQLRRAPGFALTIICTLALGIGSATAVFSVIDAVLLRPLPFANQERLIFPNTLSHQGYTQPWSYLSYQNARAQLKTFSAFAGYSDYSKINLESPTGPVSLTAVKGTDNFFDVFGIKPMLGRTYLPGEDLPGKDNVAVLSYEIWRARFGAENTVIGRTVRLDGVPYTVIGVMPAGFRFPLSARNAIYTPLHGDPRWMKSRGSHWLQSVGLIKPGVSRKQAQADFNTVLNDLGRTYESTDSGRTVKLQPLKEQVAGTTNGPLEILLLAVLALLAIACVNVAGLMLARGVKREREIALRAALGAQRLRIIRQVITESLALSAAGLALGIAVAWALLTAMREFLVDGMQRGADIEFNWQVLGFALMVSVATSVLASLAPAIRLSGSDPNRALRAGGSAGTSTGQHRLRSIFVVTQVGLSLVLLVIAGVLLRNLQALLHTDLGFDRDHILTEHLQLSPGNYAGRDPLVSFYKPLLERVAHLPGVQAAGIINILPIQSYGSNSDVHITGQPPYPESQEMLAETRLVSAGYFDAMGIRLADGRMLSAALDTPDHTAASVVVNQAFRRKFFSNGGEPVGAHIDDSDKVENKTGIVGVTTDIVQKLNGRPLAEWDFLIDSITAKERLDNLATMALVIRTSGDPHALDGALRQAIADLDPTVPFLAPETMGDLVKESLVFERMENWLFGVFAGFALLLALVGLYGLTSHEVELRKREIGIRMALGSSRGQVLRQTVSRIAILMGAGIVLGWLLTLGLKPVLASVVELHANKDAGLLLALTLTLGLVGIAASFVPARRAAIIDPVQALRSE